MSGGGRQRVSGVWEVGRGWDSPGRRQRIKATFLPVASLMIDHCTMHTPAFIVDSLFSVGLNTSISLHTCCQYFIVQMFIGVILITFSET